MRFMVIRKADANTEAEVTPAPTEDLLRAMMAYNMRMIEAGVMLDGAGLRPSAQGARVRKQGGKAQVIDGPFAEAKELVAGYSIIQCASLDEAKEWVKQWPDEDGDVEIEIRPLYEAEDFGDEGVRLMAEAQKAIDAR